MNPIHSTFAIASVALISVSCGAQENDYGNVQNYDSYSGTYYQNGSDSDQSYSAYGNAAQYNTQNAASTGQNNPGKGNQAILVDRQYNMPAIVFDVPAGYQSKGEVYWEQKFGGTNPNARAILGNPVTKASIICLPSQTFSFNSGPTFESMRQYMPNNGQNPDQRTMMDVVQALQQVILPEVQKIHGQIQITGSQHIPNLNAMFWPTEVNNQMRNDGGMISYTYQQNGVQYTAELYSVQQSMSYQSQGLNGVDTYGVWSMGRLFEISAPSAQFPSLRNEMLGIMKSVRKTPEWSGLMAQIDRQRAAEIDRQTAQSSRDHQMRMQQNQANFNAHQQRMQTLSETNDIYNQTWSNTQATNDRMHEANIDAIRGESNYVNPQNGNVYKLEDGYQYNWVNENNQVISTNDGYYHPNSDFSGNYYQLDPK